MQKKLMLLGGIRYLIPLIEAAHKQGYYVITADYLPDNVAHKYSDEYVNVSIIDKDAVLQVAQEKQIDGITSFSVDPGVTTAAYVQEKMGLPSMGLYRSVCILQNKDLFRAFLSEHGFNVPKSVSFDKSSIDTIQSAIVDFQWPIIIKPVDSSGSKGVTKVSNLDTLNDAVACALDNSRCGHIIIEEFIEAEGCPSDTDCMSVDGDLRVVSFNSQRFDSKAPNPYTPAGFTWPSTYTDEQERYLTSELQRLLHLLKMGTTVYNIETRIGRNGKPYIMECTPRGGGNRLAETVHRATGIDMITAQVRAAVGDSIANYLPAVSNDPRVTYNCHMGYVVLHAEKDGRFVGLELNQEYWNLHHVEPLDLWVKEGDFVEAFTGSNTTIGTLPMKFDTEEEMLYFIDHIDEFVKVIVE